MKIKSSKSVNNPFTTSGIFQNKEVFTGSAAECVIRAFLNSKLDYCNSLYYGLPKHLKRFLLVQNSVTRLLAFTERYDHIYYPSFGHTSLAFCPLQEHFKIRLLVYNRL